MINRRSRLITLSATTLVTSLTLLAPAANGADKNDWTMRQKGYYLTRAGDCAACHTVEEDKPMAGNYALPTPFGTIYSANLTPDDETGLGKWTEEDFFRAMNQGISRDGSRLYPAFPYTHFTYVTREDSDAIFAYLDTLEPIRQEVREPEFPWPLTWRASMIGWNMLNFEDRVFEPDPERSEEWNRGKYLVEGLAHCGMCHSPKNIIGAEKEGDKRFTGGFAEGWWAPSLTGSTRDGIGDWEKEELVEFLRHGRNDRTAAFGPMTDVIEKSTSQLTESDVSAIAEYIKSLPPHESPPVEPLKEDQEPMALGQMIYETQCSACHAPGGDGVPGQFAPLRGSSLVHSADPTTLVRAVLEGVKAVPTERYPTPQAMPAFNWKLSDEEVAAVLTYVRNSFGNAASDVSADFVADIRENAGH